MAGMPHAMKSRRARHAMRQVWLRVDSDSLSRLHYGAFFRNNYWSLVGAFERAKCYSWLRFCFWLTAGAAGGAAQTPGWTPMRQVCGRRSAAGLELRMEIGKDA